MAAAAVACRRALLLHGQHQWAQQRWAAAPCNARSISQLVKTNGRRAFLVDTLALVSNFPSASFRSDSILRKCCASRRGLRRRGVRRNASLGTLMWVRALSRLRDGRRSGSWSRRACRPSRRRRSPPRSRRSSTTASRASPSPSSPRPRCRR